MNNLSSELLESQARRAKDPHMSNYDSIVGGLPIRLDFKRYAANLASQKDVMGRLRKKGVLKGVITDPDKFNNTLIEAHSQANQAMRKAAKSMSDNEKFALGVMGDFALRTIVGEDNIRAKKPYRVFELMLVDDFLEAIGEQKIGTPANFQENLQNEYLIKQAATLLHDHKNGDLHLLDKTIAAKLHGQSTVVPPALPMWYVPFLSRLVDLRVGKIIMDVIQRDPLSDLSTKAANALFGISSMLNSTTPMVIACQLEPSLFERHFSGIESVSGDVDGGIDLAKVKIDIALMACVMHSTMLTCEYLSVVTALSPDDYQFNVANFVTNAKYVVKTGEAMIHALDAASATLVPMAKEAYASEKLALEATLAKIKDSLGTDVKDKFERIKAFDLKIQKLLEHTDKQQVSTKITSLVNLYSTLNNSLKELVDVTINARRSLNDELTNTIKQMDTSFDGAGKIKQQLDATYAEIEMVKTRFKETIDVMDNTFDNLDRGADEAIEECLKEDQGFADKDNSHPQDETYSDLEHHLDQLSAENKELSAENKTLNQELASKRAAIATLEQAMQGRDASRGYPDEEKIAAIESAITSSGKVTPESALLIVSALRDKVDILPSAFESAKESADFAQSERLLKRLLTLTGEYFSAIRGGTPDTEARKLFSLNEFAANESETTMSCAALRKERTYTINGTAYEFEQHLRIGVANDTRKTIRVYFRVIDGRMVIAYCGRHKNLH